MTTITHRQTERQRVRKHGRYSKMLPCVRCAASICDDNYLQISDDKNLQAAALAAGLPGVGVMCHKCCSEVMP